MFFKLCFKLHMVGMGSEGEMSSNYDLMTVFELIGRDRNGQAVICTNLRGWV